MKLNVFQKMAILTILATLFLILVGGLVRASGAGLGCPDWPKCYGLWIPPTSVDTLPSAYEASEFNAVKTWTEYINRLIGVLIGFFITLTFIFSFKYRKTKPVITLASFAAFVMVLFQGWVGGQVVLSGLSEWIISVHMMVAMAIVGTLIYAAFKAFSDDINISISKDHRRVLIWGSIILLILTLIQMVIGTQVREAVDMISRSAAQVDRAEWIDHIGIIDGIHRSFSWLVLISSGYLVYYVRKNSMQPYFTNLVLIVFALIISQVFVGVVLAYFGMPAIFQVLHLFGSAVMISAVLLLVFSANEAKTNLSVS
ncbi:MAG: COX15/CtaA family protein [Balneolales bacterium]|nr:COX15/CtaA family protein [Balneolales bacterium]